MTAPRWWPTTSSTRWTCSPTRRARRRRCRCSAGCSTRAARRRRTSRRSSSPSRRPTATSRTWSRETTTTRSSSRRTATPRTSRRRSRARARSSSTSTPPRWAPRSSATTSYWGHQGQPGPRRVHVLRRRRPADPRPPGQAGRRGRPDLRLRRPRRSSTTRATSSSTSRPPRTARCTCATTRSPSPTSAFARRSRCRSTGRAIIQQLFEGKAKVGNDSPFASVYPSTDTSVPQRTQNIDQAKQLLSADRRLSNPSVKLNTEKAFEIPDYAVLIQNSAKAIGFTIDIVQQTPRSTTATSPSAARRGWTRSMGITDYGHRSVPNVILGAPLLSDGTWNSAHFKNTTYDSLVKQYNAAIRRPEPAGGRQADPGAAAGRDADHLRLLLRLPRAPPPGTSAGVVITPDRPRPAGGRRLHLLTTHPRRRPGAGGGTATVHDGTLHPPPHRSRPDHALAAERPGLLPRAAAAGQRRPLILGPLAAQSTVDNLNHQLGTDKPVLVQYFNWLKGLLTATSATRSPTASRCGRSSPRPSRTRSSWRPLAFVIVVPLSLIGGIAAALKVGRPLDRIITIGGLSLAAVPEFVTSVILIMVFGIWLNVLPITAATAARRQHLGPGLPPAVTRDRAVPGAVRLHRADGPRGHDRGARLRLHAHGDAQGPAPPHGDPSAMTCATPCCRRSP